MKYLYTFFAILYVLSALPADSKAIEAVHHDLRVNLYPEQNRFTAIDTITIPAERQGDVEFRLHSGLKPSARTPGVRLEPTGKIQYQTERVSFRVARPPGLSSFTVEYGGVINYPPEAYGKSYARGIRQTPGIISSTGVYLAGSSYWYPTFRERMLTFQLKVTLPAGWKAVSQGQRTLNDNTEGRTVVRWESRQPQEEIYLVAAEFTEYSVTAGRLTSMAFLRSPDEELAHKYLEATGRYVAMYEKLIGPYPYSKFALVENFWETGFGMPSFTLLGPRVIRFPFILYSSYPHEILHNWWGNGVFPDYANGNWSEGLTAYLSDHLFKAQRGTATDYRQSTLQKYADYVRNERDFPLTQFRSRHSSSSEAVGYGKALMFFHMLRMELNDDVFVNGLQNFYRANKFQLASFDDLRRSFESVSGKDLDATFSQWITRSGAPELMISHAKVESDASGYVLKARIKQIQDGPAYRLQIPIAVTLEGRDTAFQTRALMERKQLDWQVALPARPLRFDVDPEFDLFRRLDRDEIPPALTRMFGAGQLLILLPSAAAQADLKAYRRLSRVLAGASSGRVEIELDSNFESLPPDRAVAVLGWENRFCSDVSAALHNYDVKVDGQRIHINGTRLQRSNHSVVLSAKHPANNGLSLTWVATDLPEALAGLGRKLPHYHKYSYLGFEGPEPSNILKGRWPVLESPMTVFLPDTGNRGSRAGMAKLSPRVPLANLPPTFSKKRMMNTIQVLSRDELGGRGFGSRELDQTAEFIAGEFRQAGLKPAGDSIESYFQTRETRGGSPERRVTLRNVVGVIPGKSAKHEAQSIVVGAHYDHLGRGWPDVRENNRGKIHPGARFSR